ncbi:MAG: glycosyltransferase family 2 protein [Chitinophagaceae bacterium]
MKISIITASFNSSATLADTLKCVAEQTYQPVEHLIIDGGSHDDSVAIARSFPHVAKIVSEKDKGIYDAMNKGVALASGEVIGILNSDDVYTDPTVLADIMELFKDEAVDACYADLQYVKTDDLNKVIRTWRSGECTKNSFYWGWMPPHPTFFVRKRVYDRIGNFNIELKSAADYELMLRAFMKYRLQIKYLPRIIVKMRAGGESNASLKNRLRANGEDRKAWKLNNLEPWWFTLYFKPLRKVGQFFLRK